MYFVHEFFVNMDFFRTIIFIKALTLVYRFAEASADILGAPDLYVRAGSLLRIVCTIKDSTERPEYLFWYHDYRMINYDPGVKVIPNRSSSVLLVEEADNIRSGNYTCSPSNAIPASINIHVLNATEGKFSFVLFSSIFRCGL